MSTTWKPGDVAIVTFAHGQRGPVFRVDGKRWCDLGGRWVADEVTSVALLFNTAECTGQLVVIDADNRDQVERLTKEYHRQRESMTDVLSRAEDMQAALRSLVGPPEPKEPIGLGAVVRDGGDTEWARVYLVRTNPGVAAWVSGDLRSTWADLPRPLTLLSEGYTEAGESA